MVSDDQRRLSQDLCGDCHSELLVVASGLIRRGVTVYARAATRRRAHGLDDEPIATATLLEVLDDGSGRFEGLELDGPEGAVL